MLLKNHILDITYCTHNRSISFRGELIVTKYRLLFVKKPPDPIQVYERIAVH